MGVAVGVVAGVVGVGLGVGVDAGRSVVTSMRLVLSRTYETSLLNAASESWYVPGFSSDVKPEGKLMVNWPGETGSAVPDVRISFVKGSISR